jgi:methylglutaconyl-CoA hydratase
VRKPWANFEWFNRTPVIRSASDGAVLTLTLDRPEKRNALSSDLVAALDAELVAAEQSDEVRVVVLAAAGPAFSAGADLEALRAMQSASAEENLADSERLAGLFDRLYRLRKPVIAKVAGPAVAGGCGLAAVCDIVIASEEARFGLTEVRLGFVPAIVSVILHRRVGDAALREMALRGHLMRADEAARIGLITRAVPHELLDVEVDAVAQEIASATSGTAVALTKRLLADLPGMGLAEGLSYAARLNAFARTTDDCKAGVSAFLARREGDSAKGER